MRNQIREKLNRIHELFPEERIQKSKERWRRLWTGKLCLDRNPFVYINVTFDQYDPCKDPELMLQKSLDEIILRGHLDDDYVPGIFPGCRMSTAPGLYGAPEVIAGNDYSCEKILNAPQDILSLPDPAIRPGSVMDFFLQTQKFFLEETEGEVPVHVVDMQGPFDVCGKIWTYQNMFLCAYDEPELLQKLLDKLTSGFILTWNAQKQLLGSHFTGTHLFAWDWIPENTGATMSIDSLAMISKDFFVEFFKPQLEKISRDLNGLIVHSCGDFSAVVPELCTVPGLKGINAGQMTVENLVNAGLSKDTVAIVYESYDNLPVIKRLIDEKGLNVNIGLYDVFPRVPEQYSSISSPLERWGERTWREIQARHENVKTTLTI